MVEEIGRRPEQGALIMTAKHVDTVVVGAGQAGIAISQKTGFSQTLVGTLLTRVCEKPVFCEMAIPA